MTLSAWQLLPVIGRLLLALEPPGAFGVGLAAEHAARWRVEVKHEGEDGLAGHIVKLDLAPTEVLAGSEWVDLAGVGDSLRCEGVVVRVLDIDLSSWLAGEDV